MGGRDEEGRMMRIESERGRENSSKSGQRSQQINKCSDKDQVILTNRHPL